MKLRELFKKQSCGDVRNCVDTVNCCRKWLSCPWRCHGHANTRLSSAKCLRDEVYLLCSCCIVIAISDEVSDEP